ncbi:MAG TPA: hypothetical protein VHD36_22660 [Pirellulales bacterium]|nr:hypothetical protein [Pirellulales bacterium]
MRQPINTIVGTLLIVAACGAPWARAQNQPAANPATNITVRNGGGGFGGGFLPYGGFGYGGFGMAGTPQSAAEFGFASMIAASGYANLQNSMAVQNYTLARSQDISNRIQWTNAYYQMRQAHRAYIADHTRLSMDEITKIAHDAAPKRLDAEQLDPTTGRIHWPIILQDPKYIDVCDELENLFKSRATISGFIGAESYRDINKACDRLMGLLKSNLDEYSPNDFEQAKHFVDSLRYESKFPASG